MRIGRHIFFAVIYCIGNFLHAQAQQVLTELTTSNGLSLNSVNDFLFDKQGFLWLATADGLQRYDGYGFETFRHDPKNKRSIPNNYISTLYEDNNDNLWISNYTTISVKPKGRRDFIDISSELSPFVINYAVTVVQENDSTVWFLKSGGIFSVNKISFGVKKIFALPQQLVKASYFAYSPARKIGDRVWFRERGLKDGDLYTVGNNGIKRFNNREKISIEFVIPIGRDSLVVITDRQMFISETNNPFIPVQVLKEHLDTSFTGNQFIYPPRPFANNQLLLVGTKKVFLFDQTNRTINPFPYCDYFSPDFPRYMYISAKDQAGNNWFGFNGSGGVKMLPLIAQKIKHFERPDITTMPYCLASDYTGKIYVGIYTGGIEVYNKDGEFLRRIKLHLDTPGLNSPRSIAMIDSSTLLIKATYSQLLAYDLQTQKIRDITSIIQYPPPPTPTADFEPCLQQVREGEVLLSARNNIYSIVKSKNDYSCKIVCSLPPEERISAFYRSNNGEMWIGSVLSGWYFNHGNLQRLPVRPWVKHINQDAMGRIWFATQDGIYILKNNQLIKTLNRNEGLPNSFVYGILFDENSNTWVSTNRGLARIDKDWKVTSYSVKSGLQGDEFNTHGYLKAKDGTFYFAGLNGINFFQPSDLLEKTQAFPTLLTGIEVNDNPFADSIEASTLKELRLSTAGDNIRFSFANMDFTNTGKNKFKFWLKGLEHDWTLPRTTNTVNYILAPGNYHLYVLGSNDEGIWSKEPLVFDIYILTPWYKTTMAIIGYLFIVLMVGAVSFYLLYLNRYRKKLQILQMEQEVQKEKQRLSRDLHDNLGSQITWLSNHIAQLERTEEKNDAIANKLGLLKEGTGELMQTLRETIWILNKDKVSCVELFDKVVSLAARHVEVCPPMRLQTEEKISANLELHASLALQIFRICQEAINNTCKHSNATELKISAVASDHQFKISVGDNGNGFEFTNNSIDGHYGLQNMKDRASENGLQFKISTSSQEGTTVFVSTGVKSFV